MYTCVQMYRCLGEQVYQVYTETGVQKVCVQVYRLYMFPCVPAGVQSAILPGDPGEVQGGAPPHHCGVPQPPDVVGCRPGGHLHQVCCLLVKVYGRLC